MNQTILIVEDEYLIARSIRNILQEEGYTVINDIDSVEDAMVILESQEVNLVILDINLKKEKSGIDLGHYLLAKASIPYIYITSYSDKITLDKVAETRPQGYLVKPFKAIDVKTTVSLVLSNFSLRKIDETRSFNSTTDESPFMLKKVIDYINENIGKHMTMDELALQTRWETQHFQRRFLKYIGQSPLKYINNRKIEKAKILLSETNIPTRQISFELGFISHGYFCKSFKSSTGKTPEEHRKLSAIINIRSQDENPENIE